MIQRDQFRRRVESMRQTMDEEPHIEDFSKLVVREVFNHPKVNFPIRMTSTSTYTRSIVTTKLLDPSSITERSKTIDTRK